MAFELTCAGPCLTRAVISWCVQMVWVELHSAEAKKTQELKGGTTNFDINEYKSEIGGLLQLTQDELVQMLRREGRSQAAANTTASVKGARPRAAVSSERSAIDTVG